MLVALSESFAKEVDRNGIVNGRQSGEKRIFTLKAKKECTYMLIEMI